MKRSFSLLILIVSVLAGYHILSLWMGMHLYQRDLSKEKLLEVAKRASLDPDPFYRLGILYQWDIRNFDLKESLNYLDQAIERNPLEQEYWLSLARAFQRMEKKGPFERSLRSAIRVYPTRFQGRWSAGNLLLQQGEIEEALSHFSYILAHHPEQSKPVYDVWMNVVRSPDFLLEKLVPGDPPSLGRYLTYVIQANDKATAKKVWRKRAGLGYEAGRAETLGYIDFLISQVEVQEAYKVWKDRLREEKVAIPDDGNAVTNGGFEKDKPISGGFDWRIQDVPGVHIFFDPLVYYEGKHSLRILFTGKENVNFHTVFQFVPLKQDTDYLLSARVKTKGVTTKSGVKIEVSGLGPAFYGASEALIGDNGWKELTVAFHTPAQSQGGLVRVRREPTDKFDRFISGEVWVDHVRLSEASKLRKSTGD